MKYHNILKQYRDYYSCPFSGLLKANNFLLGTEISLMSSNYSEALPKPYAVAYTNVIEIINSGISKITFFFFNIVYCSVFY